MTPHTNKGDAQEGLHAKEKEAAPRGDAKDEKKGPLSLLMPLSQSDLFAMHLQVKTLSIYR